MKLLTAALVIIFLTTTSAKPFRWLWRHDADIPDKNMKWGWLNKNMWKLWDSPEDWSFRSSSSSELVDSSESSESSESRSSESSEELVTDRATPPMTTAAVTTAAVTTAAVPTTAVTATSMSIATIEEGSTQSPEPGTANTDKPTVMETASPENITHCVTVLIPTAAPITENRGDN